MAVQKTLIYSALYIITVFMVVSVFVLSPSQLENFPALRIFIVICASLLLLKYALYMTVAPWANVQTFLRARRFARKFPLVSIIIPAWNEEVGLLSTVKTILANTYPHIEIVVVNDGSTDGSDKIMREFIAEYERIKPVDSADVKKIIKYYYKENGGKGRALNYGIEHSTGSIILSIDADCVLAKNTVANFVKVFDDPSVGAAVGNVKIGNTKTLLGIIQALEFEFSFFFKRAESVLGMVYIIGGAAGAFRREVFDKVGLYDHTTITEDIELTFRIQDAGMKIVYAQDALVYTEGAVTLKGLLKQRLRWKRGMFETLKKHRNLTFSTKRHHNVFLCWFLLPLTYFGNIQLGLELFFLAFLYIFSYITHDFSSFISGVVVVFSMFVIVGVSGDKKKWWLEFTILAPVAWLLFYLSTYVEFNSLVKAIWYGVTKQKVVWQAWQRVGIT